MARIPTPAEYIKARILSPVREFINDSRTVGIVLIICTVISLVISNTPWSASYIGFWETELNMPADAVHLPHTLLHIINDALMALFFLLVGLEIKRELLVGELKSIKKSSLPILGAVGGMVAPALVFIIWTGGTPESRGWGIPMATDIAFSLGVLSLLGKRAPLSLKIFLTALAIIDDLGAILAIAIFYTETISVLYLGLAGAVFAVLILMNLMKIERHYVYFLLGIALWYFVFNSGIHATVAGVLLAFTIPLKRIAKLEHNLHDPVSFIILPLFALANTAIIFPSDIVSVYTTPLHWGIFLGLLLGKPLGIFLICYAAVKLRIAQLPEQISWKQLWGMGMIAGIGFTMSIFISTLAFQFEELQISKIAVIGASLAAGVLGYLYLNALNGKAMKEAAEIAAQEDIETVDIAEEDAEHYPQIEKSLDDDKDKPDS